MILKHIGSNNQMADTVTKFAKIKVINGWIEKDDIPLRHTLSLMAAEVEEDADINDMESWFFDGIPGYKAYSDQDLRDDICDETEEWDEESWLGYVDQIETEIRRFKNNV